MRRAALALGLLALPAVPGAAREPAHFLFAGGGPVEDVAAPLARPEIAGVQVVYTWRALEPDEGRYDFRRSSATSPPPRRRARRCSCRTASSCDRANPDTGRPFTREEIEVFARDYLGVDVIFWIPEAPGLKAG